MRDPLSFHEQLARNNPDPAMERIDQLTAALALVLAHTQKTERS